MGLLPGCLVEIKHKAPFNGPIGLHIHTSNTLIAIRKSEAYHILVEKKFPMSNPIIALLGNPNVGKTSVFNRITKLNQHVGNYPGITVEKEKVPLKLMEKPIRLSIYLERTPYFQHRSMKISFTKSLEIKKINHTRT